MTEGITQVKCMDFAVRIVNLCRHLCDEKREYILSRQLLRSGTGAGANFREAKYAQSSADFISKCSIALKEIAETEYWLELLHRTDYLTEKEYASIQNDCSEIVRLLTSIVNTSKRKIANPPSDSNNC